VSNNTNFRYAKSLFILVLDYEFQAIKTSSMSSKI